MADQNNIHDILFPTDFSEASHNALNYAIDMAAHLGARVLMLHVYQEIPVAPGVAPPDFMDRLRAEKEEKALAAFRAYEQWVYQDKSVDIDLIPLLESGYAYDKILEVSRQENADMIVMGTQGASSTAQHIFGSLTTRVIEASECPVLAIPEGVTFQPIQHILYASNFEETDFRVLDQLLDYADIFGAQLSCAHVYAGEDYWSRLDKTFFERLYHLERQYDRLHFFTFNHRDVVGGLHRFVAANEVDMLAMLTHHCDPMAQALDESLTREMTLHTDVPLLAFHEQERVVADS
jgi:nucleotide-binding universal stress UspA family protein